MKPHGSGERPVAGVPPVAGLMLITAFALQIGWHAWRPDARAEAQRLDHPPALPVLRIAALGDDSVLAKLLMLRLQAHDEQPGTSLPFVELDYGRVAAWLDAILELDPRAEAPLLAAARLYGSVPDPTRQRMMFELVHRRFLEEPDRRWPWLAHAALIAKHRLADYPLALRYARALTRHATGPHVPAWARDMSALIAADLGEVDAARVLIGGLIESGRLTDPQEIRFLAARLATPTGRGDARSAAPSPHSARSRKPGTRSGSRPAPAAVGGSIDPPRR